MKRGYLNKVSTRPRSGIKGDKKKSKSQTDYSKALMFKADEKAGAWCRSLGRCEAEGEHGIECGGVLDWAHVKGRDSYEIRHNPLNCFCLCRNHHEYFGIGTRLWKRFVQKMRPGTWQALTDLEIAHAKSGLKVDYQFWIDYYAEQPRRAA